MMLLPFFKYYGIKQANIGVDEFLVNCPCCESQSWADIMITSSYYHFIFIPFWPVSKEANVICKKCGYKRYGMKFSERLISNYQEIKSQYRHPWYTYIGLSIGIVLILSIILIALAE